MQAFVPEVEGKALLNDFKSLLARGKLAHPREGVSRTFPPGIFVFDL